MATTVARLQAVLSANTRDFDRAMHTSEGRLKSIGKTAGLAVGAAGLGAIAVTLRAGIKEWTESTKVTAQTNAVIKSTGGVAGVTAKHVDALAKSMLRKTGIDDEAIRTSENLLLGFTHLRNEVGKGNDVFDRATKIVQDYSVRTGKSATMASIAFGKALNDPVKGMGALGRAGIVLTDAQKKTIKGFVDAGTPIKAQTYLLGLLETRFGGAAEAAGKTLPGQIAIARESFKNFAGDLIAKMIPVLEQVVAWVRDHWPEISKKFQEGWAIIKPILDSLGILIVSIVTTIRNHWGTIGPIVNAAVKVIRDALLIIGGIIKVFSAVLRGDWSEAWNQLKGVVANAFRLIRDLLIYEKDLVVAIVKGIGTAAWQGLAAAFNAAWEGVKGAVSGLFHKIVDWIKDFLGIKSPSAVFHDIGVNMIKGLIGGIGSMGGALKNFVIKTVKSLPGAVGGVIGGVLGNHPGPSNFGGIVGVGKWLQGLGFQVSENPAFGGVSGGHVPGSYHYKGRAIDVNWPGGGAVELTHLQAVFGAIKALRPVEEMIEDAGKANQHLHVAMAKGGVVTQPTRALIGEAGPEAVVPMSGLKGGSWQERYFNFMQRVWRFARPYFPNALGGMPPVRFTEGADSLFVGTDFTPDAKGNVPAAGRRTLFWPKWLSFFANRGKAISAYLTLIHEWAHEFQSLKQTGNFRLSEGGAEAFAEAYTPAIYRGLGFNIRPDEIRGSMYNVATNWVRRNKGMDWISRGQFGVFDKGGYLQPGLTMAYNGTGRPEPVGGGNITIPVSIAGEHVATVVFDMLRRKARVFENRNGRLAFGG